MGVAVGRGVGDGGTRVAVGSGVVDGRIGVAVGRGVDDGCTRVAVGSGDMVGGIGTELEAKVADGGIGVELDARVADGGIGVEPGANVPVGAASVGDTVVPSGVTLVAVIVVVVECSVASPVGDTSATGSVACSEGCPVGVAVHIWAVPVKN
jgi:hypothetical protein